MEAAHENFTKQACGILAETLTHRFIRAVEKMLTAINRK